MSFTLAPTIMSPRKPHFFQPLLPGFENESSIPVSFFKHLKGVECDKAVLRSLSGKLWHVKINGRRFEDGWKEFSKYHALHVGDFLVFRHEGNMVFDVMVFDRSTCEREYTSFHVKQEMETSQEEEEEEVPKESEFGEFTNKKTVPEQKPDSSVLENPHFVVNMTSYNASNARKNIPRKFARANGLHNRHCKIVLVDQEGRSWLADIGYKKSDGQVYIGGGWRTFRIANDLKKGDSFIFELIKKGRKPVLKMRKLKRNPEPKRAGTSSTRSPHFSVTIKASYSKNSQLKIPGYFARRINLLRKHAKIILTNERGNSWLVPLVKHRSGDIYIGNGWSAFAAANGLREGDEIMLELIKEGDWPAMRIYGTTIANKTNKKFKMESN